jgi:hypothetical protein
MDKKLMKEKAHISQSSTLAETEALELGCNESKLNL